MSNTKTGGPAFPCEIVGIDELGEYRKPFEGMTLRDYFAGQAIASTLPMPGGMYVAADYARLAYEMADAMLKAREA